MSISVKKENLIKGKSVIFDKTRTRKSRFYLIFDRIENDQLIGKTFPRKTSNQREELIPLKDAGSILSLI